MTDLTQYSILLGDGTSTIKKIAPNAAFGIALVSQGLAADPAYGTLSVGGGGTGLISLVAHALYVGNGALPPTALAVGLTGTVLQGNTGANPTFSTATYPSTTTVSQILYSSATNTVAGLATANSATLVTTSAGVPVFSGTMTDGMVIIGSTGATPTAATLIAGAGVGISNGSGTITISAAGGGLAWSVQTSATQAMSVANGYIANRAGTVTYTLPATAVVGDTISVTGMNTATGWLIAQNANQQIFIGTSSTTVGVAGSLASTNIRDAVTLVCVVAGASTNWTCITVQGNITVV